MKETKMEKKMFSTDKNIFLSLYDTSAKNYKQFNLGDTPAAITFFVLFFFLVIYYPTLRSEDADYFISREDSAYKY